MHETIPNTESGSVNTPTPDGPKTSKQPSKSLPLQPRTDNKSTSSPRQTKKPLTPSPRRKRSRRRSFTPSSLSPSPSPMRRPRSRSRSPSPSISPLPPRRRRRSPSYSRSHSRSPSSSDDSLASGSSRSYSPSPPPRRRRRLNNQGKSIRSRRRYSSTHSSDFSRSPGRSRSHSRSRSPPRGYRERSTRRRQPTSRRKYRHMSSESERSLRSHSSRSHSPSLSPPRRRGTYRPRSPLPPRRSPPRYRKRISQPLPPPPLRRDRDRRTVFVSQLAARVRERDVYKFFSKAGAVRDVRLIHDRHSARHKGAGYVEFHDASSVPKAVRMDSYSLCGFPVLIKPSVEQMSGKDSSLLPPMTGGNAVSPRREAAHVPPIRDGAIGWRNRTPVRQVTEPSQPQQLARHLPSKPAQLSLGGVVQPQNEMKLVSIEELRRMLNPNNLPPPNAVPLPSAGAGSIQQSDKNLVEPVPLPTAATASVGLGFQGKGQELSQTAKLYIGSIAFHLKKEDLEKIFQPFGPILSLDLQIDADGRSRGYGFIEFATIEAAEKALEINGLAVAGRNLKVARASHDNRTGSQGNGLTDASEQVSLSGSAAVRVPLPGVDVPAEIDDGKDGGLALHPSQRMMLMQQLSGGENMGGQLEGDKEKLATVNKASRSLMLSNMFDPATEEPGFERELAEDVRDECASEYGAVTHLHVETKSHGIVYIRFLTIRDARKAQSALNGRWFGGKRIKASFVVDEVYENRFPKAPK